MKKIYIILVLLINLFLANAQTITSEANSLLIAACESNDLIKVKNILLSKSHDINVLKNGLTPLVIAVQNENIEMVKLLISNGADVNLESSIGTPMWQCSKNSGSKKSKTIFDYLLKTAVKNVYDPSLPFSLYFSIYQTLGSKYTEFESIDIQIFKIFPDKTHLGTVRVLCDAIGYNQSNLTYLIKNCNYPMEERKLNDFGGSHLTLVDADRSSIRLSLKPDASWSAEITDFISESLIDKLNIVIQQKLDPNILLEEKPPLLLAVKLGDLDKTQKLIDLGANINIKKSGGSAVYFACMDGFLPIVELLCSKGVNLDEKADNGWSCIHIASTNGHAKVVEFLIAKGLSSNTQTSKGLTALMLASYNGYPEVVKLLISKKADPNITAESNGNTALHYACIRGNVSVVKMLLLAGAKKEIKNNKGLTPAEVAKNEGKTKVLELMKK